jgi:hypothetical protein
MVGGSNIGPPSVVHPVCISSFWNCGQSIADAGDITATTAIMTDIINAVLIIDLFILFLSPLDLFFNSLFD